MNESKKREALDLRGSVMDLMITLSEGNPGAARVLSDLAATIDRDRFAKTLLTLDDMNIRGTQIWVGFNDFAKGDIKAFYAAVFSRNKDMIKVINATCTYNDGPIARRYPEELDDILACVDASLYPEEE
jgi:hypothetical protein